MKAQYLLPMIALTLAACSGPWKHNSPPIKPETAKITPPGAKFSKLRAETLSNEARTLLDAKDEKDLVIVVKAKGGSVVYGAPGRGFKKAEEGDLERFLEEARKRDIEVEVVNTLTVKTLRASPECQWYEDAGDSFWYEDESCPSILINR